MIEAENAVQMPDEWRALVHPRRGGTAPAEPVEADPAAVRPLREATATAMPLIEAMLGHAHTQEVPGEAVRRWLRGEPDPLGAAAVASILIDGPALEESDREALKAALVDAWIGEHGLPFAACAFTDLCEIHLGGEPIQPAPRGSVGGIGRGIVFALDTVRDPEASPYRRHGGIRRAGPWENPSWWWSDGTAGLRLRTLLAAAGEDEYRAAVDGLAGHRYSSDQRMAAAYLVPTEHAWVDECVEDQRYIGRGAYSQLLCSLSAAEQLERLRSSRNGAPSWNHMRPDVLATLLDTVGAAAAPHLIRALPSYEHDDDRVRALIASLGMLPSDQALGALLERFGQKHATAALRLAVERFPGRAIRVLAPVASGETTAAPAAAGLVRARLRAAPGLVDGLPAETRELIEQFLPRAAVRDAEDLPEVLVSPPWTRRGRTKTKKAAVSALPALPPFPEPGMVWEPGEREAWERAGRPPFWTSGPEKIDWAAASATWVAANMARAGEWLPPVVARFGLEALPLVLGAVARSPGHHGEMLLPYLDAEVARTMARWLARLKSARTIARRWFRRHGAAAVPLLLPAAFGKAGPERRDAEGALRALAAEHGDEAVVKAAEDAGPAVGALLALDPLEVLPARIPKVTWVGPAELPQVLLRDRRTALPAAATGHLLTMLAMSKPGDEYAGLGAVRELCDPVSLAEFSWAVFLHWQARGGASKDNWAMTQLGLLGDDTTVRRLAPLIRRWPGEGGTARAVVGLEVLAGIGTDVALTHLYALARKGRHKGLKAKAMRRVEEIATARGLTNDQLADRAVPDFGLDAEGGMVFDYGPRRFEVRFDEQLAPYVIDEKGKLRRSLPKPRPADDPDLAPVARTLFDGLRKDVRTIAEAEIKRLEAAMVRGRRWDLGEFRDVFLRHPLLWHLVRRLVWLAEHDGRTTAFRVAEDRTFADVEDDAFDPPASSRVGLAHPVRLGESTAAWSELFADYEILQPFPQLGRPVHTLTDEERAATRLTRVEGRVAPYGKVKGLSQGSWLSGADYDCWIARQDPSGRYVVAGIDPGLEHYSHGHGADQRFARIWAGPRPAPRPVDPIPLGDIDPVTMSEALHDLIRVSEK
ncbi:DUF4132 domain-containing protein [Spirillospora sp. NPDC029432]|uniref:DUF4132 domain-containing protein n=1 Tax=Spirillospora sp. NPDC029432 TaxID=3154599 RepID=UPI003455EDC6